MYVHNLVFFIYVIDEFQTFVITKLTNISFRLQNIEKSMKNLEAKLNTDNFGVADADTEEDFELPLNTIGELEEFEQKLKRNEFLNKVVCFFSLSHNSMP